MQRYPEMMIAPMRRQITELGAEELRTPDAVDAFLEAASGGTALIVVNSVCGCSAGSLRPGLELALEQGARPDRMATVFAGADLDATERARRHFAPHPPSSPAMALFHAGELVCMIDRRQIQGRTAESIATALCSAMDAVRTGASSPADRAPAVGLSPSSPLPPRAPGPRPD